MSGFQVLSAAGTSEQHSSKRNRDEQFQPFMRDLRFGNYIRPLTAEHRHYFRLARDFSCHRRHEGIYFHAEAAHADTFKTFLLLTERSHSIILGNRVEA